MKCILDVSICIFVFDVITTKENWLLVEYASVADACLRTYSIVVAVCIQLQILCKFLPIQGTENVIWNGRQLEINDVMCGGQKWWLPKRNSLLCGLRLGLYPIVGVPNQFLSCILQKNGITYILRKSIT